MEIWGHRGAYSHAPENTLSGFQIAADMGADGVEFDIQLTHDGEIVVIHDETVDRTSDGRGWVKDLTLSELKKLNFNKRGITQPLFMEIPTLAEVFEILKPTRLKMNIEFKTGLVNYDGIEKKAHETAVECGVLERIVWSSFNHYSVQRLKKLAPEAETALLCSGGILVTGEQCKKTGASALHPDISQFLRYPELVEDCHTSGTKVRVWTINRLDEYLYARSAGVDAVFTNTIDLSWKKAVNMV